MTTISLTRVTTAALLVLGLAGCVAYEPAPYYAPAPAHYGPAPGPRSASYSAAVIAIGITSTSIGTIESWDWPIAKRGSDRIGATRYSALTRT